MSELEGKPSAVRDNVHVDEIVDLLRSADRAFKRDAARFRFEGMRSRVSVLTASRERERIVEMMRMLGGVFAAPVDAENVVFFRLSAGDYLLPTAWEPAADGPALQLLMLGESPDDALTVSTENGAKAHDVRMGRTLVVHQACRFWIGPTVADALFLAVAGLEMS
ncbi:MAG: hypothetical protein VW405_21665 [Rhodospirillaceae bacterium]